MKPPTSCPPVLLSHAHIPSCTRSLSTLPHLYASYVPRLCPLPVLMPHALCPMLTAHTMPMTTHQCLSCAQCLGAHLILWKHVPRSYAYAPHPMPQACPVTAPPIHLCPYLCPAILRPVFVSTPSLFHVLCFDVHPCPESLSPFPCADILCAHSPPITSFCPPCA